MGAHSTIIVSRRKARIMMSMFSQIATDEDLESMMDIMLYDQLYNCMVQDAEGEDELAMSCLDRYVEKLDEAEEKPFAITIRWGKIADTKPKETYRFKTQAELDAFSLALAESDGWMDYEIED